MDVLQIDDISIWVMNHMGGLSQEQMQRIIKVLEEKGAKLPCPRCGSRGFTLLNGYFNQTVQIETSGLVIGGMAVPTVVVLCDKCGFISQHALSVLGLLPSTGEARK